MVYSISSLVETKSISSFFLGLLTATNVWSLRSPQSAFCYAKTRMMLWLRGLTGKEDKV